ncbi:hypothetical protein [Bradyrhizobium sp. 191]|uniref:hypothetical protein n=1 Tax=Bradyrhizobium sp. 191 TaxID=2782659 RepID=UPI001FFE452D|nr:hypothetical protein [Bradyrhizobium sp. 191]UPJ68528.1 hypothetical protein IVB23_15460 [Bradyrhizobium sp. 191]
MNDEIIEVVERVAVVFATEGHAGHHDAEIGPTTTVKEFVDIAATKAGIEGLLEVYAEDAEEPLGHELILVEHLSAEFAPLHVATPGKIATTVRYQARQVEHPFRPAATIAKVTKWAVEKLAPTEDPSDFQLKHDGKVLPPDSHLGQAAHGAKSIVLDLVFKVKPQG